MKLVIIDFEATCWDSNGLRPLNWVDHQEIIEFGCVLADEKFVSEGELCAIVTPIFNPQLTEFCTSLTSIDQGMIDTMGVPFVQANTALSDLVEDDDIFCSWGNFDDNLLRSNCNMHKVEYPFKNGHVNLKTMIGRLMHDCDQPWRKQGVGLIKACTALDIGFEGTLHRGIDDARNILRVLVESQKIIGDLVTLIDEIRELSKKNKRS